MPYLRRLIRGVERVSVDLGSRVHLASTRLERWGREFTAREREGLLLARRRIASSTRAQAGAARRRHRQLADRLSAVDPRARLATERARLHDLQRRLSRVGDTLCDGPRLRLARAAGKLDALSPLSVLARGFALVRREDGSVIRSADQAELGEVLRVSLDRGSLEVEVSAVHEEHQP